MKSSICILALLTFFSIPHVDGAENEAWAVGRWLSKEVIHTSPSSEDAPKVMEKHILFFHKDGLIQRYSQEKGLENLAFGYRAKEKKIYLQDTGKKYILIGHLKNNGELAMDFRKRIILYEQISPLTPLSEVDVDGYMTIQFRKQDMANQQVEPTVTTPVE